MGLSGPAPMYDPGTNVGVGGNGVGDSDDGGDAR